MNCLVTFEALARNRSVTKTANELCVTPSAVSQRIRLLESIVQEVLFWRTGFSLTESGQAYLAVVRESLQLLQSYSE